MGEKVSQKPWLWALAAVLINGAPAALACEGPTIKGSRISGRVYDLLGGDQKPLAGASVRLLNASGKEVAQAAAGQDGRFSISAPERGKYRLTVSAEGFVEVGAAVVTKKLGKDSPFLRVDVGSDSKRPCGGGGITIATNTGGTVGRSR